MSPEAGFIYSETMQYIRYSRRNDCVQGTAFPIQQPKIVDSTLHPLENDKIRIRTPCRLLCLKVTCLFLLTFVFKSNLSLLIDFKFLRQVNPIFQTRWIFFIKILNKTSSWSPICYLLRPPSPCYFNSRYHPEYWKFHILDTDALAN